MEEYVEEHIDGMVQSERGFRGMLERQIKELENELEKKKRKLDISEKRIQELEDKREEIKEVEEEFSDEWGVKINTYPSNGLVEFRILKGGENPVPSKAEEYAVGEVRHIYREQHDLTLVEFEI